MKIFLSHSASDTERLAPLVARLRESAHEIVTAETHAADLAAVVPAILSSQAIVAFLSNDANTAYFELGLAMGASLPAMVIAAEDVSVPTDVATAPFIRLSGDASRDAANVLAGLEKLEAVGSHREKPSLQHLKLAEIADDPQLVDRMSPDEFERLVGDLLEVRGWSVEREAVLRGARVDLLLRDDDERLAIVEVKKVRSQGRVSVEAVRELLSRMAVVGASSGMLVSTAGFTSSALAMAAGTGAVLVTLRELLSSRPDPLRRDRDASTSSVARD